MKLWNYLLYILIYTASLRAMDDARVVPYNYEKHNQAAERIFEKIFDDAPYADPAIIEPDNTPDSHVAILEHNDQVAGFAIYNHKDVPKNKVFPDVRKHRTPIKVCHLDYIAVDYDQQGKGFGTQLIEYVEKRARNNNDDMIMLNSINNSYGFYKKRNFTRTMPQSPTNNGMAKSLNKKADSILRRVIRDRRLGKGSSAFMF